MPEVKIRQPGSDWSRLYGRPVLLLVAGLALLVVIGSVLAPSISSASFSFLFDATGWDVGYSLLPYTSKDPYWWAFVVGLSNTVVSGSIGILGATALGFLVGLARSSGNQILGDIGRLYVDVVRNIPLILQAMFWYAVVLHLPPARSAHALFDIAYLSNRGLYIPRLSNMAVVCSGFLLIIIVIWGGANLRKHIRSISDGGRPNATVIAIGGLTAAASAALLYIVPLLPQAFTLDMPTLTGLNFRGGAKIPPEFAALTAAVTIYRGAFISEVFRGGFASVSSGQIDAARSLGLRPWAILLKIRVPLALISIIPPLSSEFIIIMKVTSVGIVVGFWDLFAVSSQSANLTGRPLEVLFVMMLIYLVLNYSMVAIMNAMNRRVRVPGLGADA